MEPCYTNRTGHPQPVIEHTERMRQLYPSFRTKAAQMDKCDGAAAMVFAGYPLVHKMGRYIQVYVWTRLAEFNLLQDFPPAKGRVSANHWSVQQDSKCQVWAILIHRRWRSGHPVPRELWAKCAVYLRQPLPLAALTLMQLYRTPVLRTATLKFN
ncbi:hypothetical protein BDV12DRAFT_130308 [Aspergillus spectabilis]